MANHKNGTGQGANMVKATAIQGAGWERAAARAVALSATAMLLSGCFFNWPYDRQLTSAVVAEPVPLDGYQYTLAEDVPLSRAFVALPYIAGQAIAVRETRYANGIEQKIVLASEATSDGENYIEVRAVQPNRSDSRVVDQHLKTRSTDSVSIKKELRDFVWGTKMAIVPTIETNAYGAYGYALGQRSGGYGCMYGWQTVKGQEKRKNLIGIFWTTSTELSVRVRLCRSDLSQNDMIAIMRGLRVTMDPNAMDIEPKMHWGNDAYGVSAHAAPGSAIPGYVTEGVAPVASAPAAASPVIDGTIPPQAPAATAPRRAPVARSTAPSARPPATTRPRTTTPAPANPSADGLIADPDRNRTTIFVDPREYAAVPLPGDVANAPQIRQGTTSGSRFSAPGTVPSAAPSAGLNDDAARENRKQALRSISGVTNVPGPGWTPDSGGGTASTYGRDSRDLFLAPEREGYRGLDLERLRKEQNEGANVKHNLWLNDKARNDNDGMPLQRPCELIRDAECTTRNAEDRGVPTILRN